MFGAISIFPVNQFHSSLPVLFIAVAFHIPSFLEPRCLEQVNSTAVHRHSISHSELHKNKTHYYYGYKDVARIIVFAAIPFVMLVYLYARVYLEVCRVKRMCFQLQEHNQLKNLQVAVLKN